MGMIYGITRALFFIIMQVILDVVLGGILWRTYLHMRISLRGGAAWLVDGNLQRLTLLFNCHSETSSRRGCNDQLTEQAT